MENMCNKKKIFSVIICSLFGLFYIARTIAAPAMVINTPVANIYTNPDDDSSLTTQAIYGSSAKILQNKSDWALITTDDNYHGWIKANNLTEERTNPSISRVKIKNLFAYVYLKPITTEHLPIMLLPYGVNLPIIKIADARWIQVQLVDGKSGWIQQGDVSINPKPLSMPEMLKLSRNFLGLPYLWAGTTTYGFDCSGFVQFLFRDLGIILPRDAEVQANSPLFTEVSKQELKPGDILFFGWNKKISHEAVYLGNDTFINSTPFGGPIVHLSNLNEPHWKEIYITARRLNSNLNTLPKFRGNIEPLSSAMKQKMQKYTWHEGCPVALEDLSSVTVSYIGFDSKKHIGTLIVNTKLAEEVFNIFEEIYNQKFPIEKIQPIEEYEGNDDDSMLDNNTSAFNCRAMTDFADKYSIHSYGRAIDINPLINPYTNGDKVEPKEGTAYLDRNIYHKGKITEQSSIVQIFAKYGWIWGGNADSSKTIKDYQHFEKQS